MSAQPFVDSELFHLKVQTLAWSVFANIGMLAPLFRHSVYAYYVHWLMMSFTVVLTIFAPIGLYIDHGLIQDHSDHFYPHMVGALIMFVMLLAIVVLGALTRYYQQASRVDPSLILNLKRIHALLGTIAFVLAKAILLFGYYYMGDDYRGWFVFLLIYEVIFFVARTAYRIFRPQLQSNPKDTQLDSEDSADIRTITNKNDLKIYAPDYYIFADHVYSTDDLYSHHPGGAEIVKSIRGREVDRFVYGVQVPEQFPDLETIPHSQLAMRLGGAPLAKFIRRSPYRNINESHECFVLRQKKLSEMSPVYFVEIASKGKDFTFDGLTDISQLGQYWTLTISDKITRLYTAVNSLHQKNRDVMMHIFPQLEKEGDEIKSSSYSAIPLMMKKYNKGKLTSSLLRGQYDMDVKITPLKGSGLSLQNQPPGKIILVGGGTGVYPFVDTIDSLFKTYYSMKNPAAKSEFYIISPLLKEKVLEKFQWEVMFAFDNIRDLHPITIYQIDYLTKEYPMIFKCTMKLKNSSAEFQNYLQNVRFTKDYFDLLLKNSTLNATRNLSQIYVCGPARLTSSILDAIDTLGIDNSKYTII